ncbi:MAG: hypothetical protein NT069_11685 [Planctomycetota bacterium]|nr:hypothetical protein [Planctomycetota bacterium]
MTCRYALWILAGSFCLIWTTARAVAQPAGEGPAPPSNLVAADHPGDNGNAIDLKWTLSGDDNPDIKPRRIRAYRIDRTLVDKPLPDEAVLESFEVPYGVAQYTDRRCRPSAAYRYSAVAIAVDDSVSPPVETSGETRAVRQWFDNSRTSFAVIAGGGRPRHRDGASVFVHHRH